MYYHRLTACCLLCMYACSSSPILITVFGKWIREPEKTPPPSSLLIKDTDSSIDHSIDVMDRGGGSLEQNKQQHRNTSPADDMERGGASGSSSRGNSSSSSSSSSGEEGEEGRGRGSSGSSIGSMDESRGLLSKNAPSPNS